MFACVPWSLAVALSQFGAVGEKLDPNLHEVLFEAPHATLPPGTLCQVIKCGYYMKERVLRPAKVGVVKRAGAAAAAPAPKPMDSETA